MKKSIVIPLILSGIFSSTYTMKRKKVKEEQSIVTKKVKSSTQFNCWENLPVELQVYIVSLIINQEEPIDGLKQLKKLEQVSTGFQSLINDSSVAKIIVNNVLTYRQRRALEKGKIQPWTKTLKSLLAKQEHDAEHIFRHVCSSNCTTLAELFIEKDINIHISDKYSMTPLLLAAKNGRWAILKLLIEKDACVDPKKWLEALLTSGRYKHKECIEGLLAYRNFSDPLLSAIMKEDYVTIKELLEENIVAINSSTEAGLSAFMLASNNGCIPLVKLLIKKGVNTKAKTKAGLTALYFAACNGHAKIVKLLLKENPESADTAFILSVAASRGYTDIVQLLLKSGIDVNAKDGNGNTALVYATSNGKATTVKALIDAGAHVMPDLMFAAADSDIEIINLLIEAGTTL